MKLKYIFATVALLAAMTSCTRTNPFFTEWNTPYGIPPFEQIQDADYVPAINAGIEQQLAEIDAIVASTEEPTFDNVIAALDRSGALLDKVSRVLFNLSESTNTPGIQKIVEEVTPIVSAHSDNIYMNAGLFAKVKAVYDKKAELGLTVEQEQVLERTHRAFVQNGIALDEAGQARMREINTELATLSLRFGNNLLAENNAFKAAFDVAISEYPTAMATCEDRDRREAMFRAYSMRGNNGNEYDNKQIVLDILRLKIEKSKMLGYDTPAAFILSDKMAKTPKAVDDFLANIMKYAVRQAKAEVFDMQKVMDGDIASGLLPVGSKIQPWDWFYYAERVRKAKYDLDENAVMPYFKMENVREGVFSTASRLYGLQFEPIPDAPKYHPDMEAFRVSDADGSLIGILLTDYFPRETKRGGAWMDNIREQYRTPEGENVRPIIVNVGNFNKPTADKPSLLSIDNVETMFHEFGHALHSFVRNVHYSGVSGTERDFVELPSQINEHWAFEPEVLKVYAKHYKTGEVIPQELIDKIEASGKYGQGFATVEYLAASYVDMDLHVLTEVPANFDVMEFQAKKLAERGIPKQILPRYSVTNFSHSIGGGYSAGYYSYIWAEVLDCDAFQAFKETGDIFNQDVAQRFCKFVLTPGGIDKGMVMYRNFRGRDPKVDGLLENRGLK